MVKELNQLNERSQDILGEIVDIYTQTGTPVGSKAIAENLPQKISSATIRNVMAELEAKGYLKSPHTSAGRVPTDDAFRFYAQGLVQANAIDKDIEKQISEYFAEDREVKEIMDNMSGLLSSLTSCASVVVAPRLEREELKQMEFVRLQNDQVLAVLVGHNGSIENRMIHVPDNIDEDTLNQAALRLKEHIDGMTLADARVEMMEGLMEQKNRVDQLMNSMMGAAETWGQAPDTDSALVVAGSQNLFQYPELVRDQLKNVFSAFEEKRMLMALMNEVQKGEGVQLFIGKDCPIDSAEEFSMVTTTYGSDDKSIMGTLGVIGPVRMDYKKTIQVVDYTGKMLSRVINERRLAAK
ncbi:MAG: heat-inducible transcriptional repressor HrcA [Pseudomonadota bacterium]|nr:heat-inducible transcriptional repressor HrcA [Pseudomonadota bacterium]